MNLEVLSIKIGKSVNYLCLILKSVGKYLSPIRIEIQLMITSILDSQRRFVKSFIASSETIGFDV
jgi:hypothetical protein